MKLLLSSIVLVTLTVFAKSSVDNESNLRVLKSAKGSKVKAGVKSSKAPKWKGGKNGGGYYPKDFPIYSGPPFVFYTQIPREVKEEEREVN